MTHGPNPWHQQHWDWRAALNFMAGGAGSGLVLAAALASSPGLLLAGGALIVAGLTAVWFEIGRPWRAPRVLTNPSSSWMTREAMVAFLLALALLLAVAGMPGAAPAAAMLALAFVYCQGRMLRAARGIPAWRQPLGVPLIVATGLAEGAGLWMLFSVWQGPASVRAWLGLALLLVARLVLWQAWRQRLHAVKSALTAIDRAGLAFQGTTLLALALGALCAALPLPPPLAAAAQAGAGALAAAGGAWFKYTLIARAAFNQGYALAHLPVRGGRRSEETARWA